eukprot:GEMP01000289.1.p1 GENE.GEMP01000289.1~~GEMP01000289.1.p1  ORF type:complete len:2487 (+),score=732.48 GEMP01000289.1:46-7506(+)
MSFLPQRSASPDVGEGKGKNKGKGEGKGERKGKGKDKGSRATAGGYTESSKDRRFFDRMLKSGDAFQRSGDGRTFLRAACEYDDKLDLLVQLASPTLHGHKVLLRALASETSSDFFDSALLPFLALLGSDAVCAASMCQSAVKGIIELVYTIPGFLGTLHQYVETCVLREEATVGWFVLMCCRDFETARRDDGNIMRRVADILIERNAPAARQLRTVLGIGLTSEQVGGSPEVVGIEDLRQEAGGRHDNDMKDFRSIALIPTIEELGCTEQGYLPKQGSTEAAALDRNFRLLREDVIGPARVDLEQIQQGGGNRRNVYEEVGVEWACTKNDRKRPCVLVSFSLPSGHKSKRYKSKKDRIAFFDKECGGMLPVDALVCLAVHARPAYVATVVVRESKLLAEERPTIGLEFHGSSDTVADLLKYSGCGGLPHLQLIQVSTNFFAYMPVLAALQKADMVPLAEELTCGDRWSQFPIYLAGVNATPSDTLDPSQRAAVELAMRSRVAITQGPPGTGKTFVGVEICDIILKETTETILCVCYTNHALDQFLESLLDKGVSSIVRIGGRSKSVRLEPFNIRELSFNSRSLRPLALRRRVAILKEQEESLCFRIESGGDKVWQAALGPNSWSVVNEFLCQEYPDQYHQLALPEQQDGFVVVGKNGKALAKDSVWKDWVNGKQLPQLPEDAGAVPEGNLWQLDDAARKEILSQWSHEISLDDREMLASNLNAIRQNDTELHNLHKESYVAILKNARVIGCTTTGAALHVNLLASAAPAVVLVEEAAEILEAHVLSCLHPKVKHLIMIGDHKQLRPKVENYELSVASGNQHDLNRSLFERLVMNEFEHATLQVQHRMRPEISRLIKCTYPQLQDHPSVENRPDLRGVASNVVFVDHDGLETQVDNWKSAHESKSNLHEAQLAMAITVYMIQQGYKADQIVILTPYLGQLLAIQQLLRKQNVAIEVGDKDISDLRQAAGSQAEYIPGVEKGVKSVRVATIDNYQGEEADVVIGSLVRNNAQRSIGFLREPERVNVLLSRARYGLILIGNRTCLTKTRNRCGAKLWSDLFEQFDTHKQVHHGFPTVCPLHKSVVREPLASAEAFAKHVPDGGCALECSQMLPCGHFCPLKCHTWPAHEDVPCTMSVSSFCDRGHLASHACAEVLQASQCKVCNEIRKLEREREKKIAKLKEDEAKKMEEYDLRRAKAEEEAKVLQEQLDRMRREEEAEIANERRKIEHVKKEHDLKMAKDYRGDKLDSKVAEMTHEAEKEMAAREEAMAAKQAEMKAKLQRLNEEKAAREATYNEELQATRNKINRANQNAATETGKYEKSDASHRDDIQNSSKLVDVLCTIATANGDLRAALDDASDGCVLAALNDDEKIARHIRFQLSQQTAAPYENNRAYVLMKANQWLKAYDVLSAPDAKNAPKSLLALCEWHLGSDSTTNALPQTDDAIGYFLAAARLDAAIDKREQPRDKGIVVFSWALASLVHSKSAALVRDRTIALLVKHGRALPAASVPRSTVDDQLKWQKQAGTSKALGDLLKLTGLNAVKKRFFDVNARIQLDEDRQLDFTKSQYSIRFDGNPGTGKTTVARLYGTFLKERKVLKADTFVETSGAALLNGGVEELKKHLKTVENGGVLFIDEAYQLNPSTSQAGAQILDYLLPEMENMRGKLVVVVAGYAKKMDDLFAHNEGFPSRFPHTFTFADYTDAELLAIFLDIIQVSPFHLKEDRVARIATRRLGQQRGAVGFGNARAVRNLYDNALTQQATRVLRERDEGRSPDPFLLERDDVLGPRGINAKSCPALAQLEAMRGLQSVKNSIQTMLKTVETNAELEEQERPMRQMTLNRVFLGNPGTGKTTVASIYGQMLNALGLLSKGEVVVRSPHDFIGSVLGESEKKTKVILDAARGSVLVIDEAYGLHASKGTTDPYKTAVIDTIVAEVQGVLGDDRCVLLVGYKEQMETMIRDANPGLARRFQISDAFYFEDYNDEDLLAILRSKAHERRMPLTLPVARAGVAVLEQERRQPNFGNAGAVNNLLSRAVQKMEARLQGASAQERADAVLDASDFTTAEQDSMRAVDLATLFDGLVGCKAVREKLDALQRTIAFSQQLGKDPLEEIELNFFFAGSPGTGKTTVARLMGKMLAALGLLGSSEVVECSASDFVTGYVNQASGKTRELFRSALGKVLFIDEAYRLHPQKGGPMMSEVLDEIVQLLTEVEFKNKMAVIFAGYNDELNALLEVNPGLKSRVSEHILFDDFPPDVAAGLLRSQLKNKGLELAAEVPVTKYMATLCAAPHWSNGRDVDTLSKRVFQAIAQAGVTELTVTEDILKRTINAFVAEKRATDTTKPSLRPTQLTQEYATATAKRSSPPVTPTTVASTDVEAGIDSDAGESADVSKFAGLPRAFLTELQDVLLTNDIDITDAEQVLAFAENSKAVRKQFDADLLAKWQTALRKAMAEEKRLAEEVARKQLTQRPLWRCAICGRPNCRVAPYIEGYELV